MPDDVRTDCDVYISEERIMSDIPYTSSGLEDWCPESSSRTSRSSNWMSITGLALSALALGTAIYAAFAPRSVVERGRQKVSQMAEQAKQKAREASEQLEGAVSSGRSSTTTSPSF